MSPIFHRRQLHIQDAQWTHGDSNPEPAACKAAALPIGAMSPLVRYVEHQLPRWSIKWRLPGESYHLNISLWNRRVSNPQPPVCQTGALPIALRPRGMLSSSPPTRTVGASPETVYLHPKGTRQRRDLNPRAPLCRRSPRLSATPSFGCLCPLYDAGSRLRVVHVGRLSHDSPTAWRTVGILANGVIRDHMLTPKLQAASRGGAWIRTRDLRVMSPTRFRTAPLRTGYGTNHRRSAKRTRPVALTSHQGRLRWNAQLCCRSFNRLMIMTSGAVDVQWFPVACRSWCPGSVRLRC